MAKTLQQFREWAVKQGGGISNPTNVAFNKYPGECVSLIQQYLNQVFGVAYAARGHASYFLPPTFTQVATNAKLMPGDIVRYPSSFGGGYGHIELIDDDGKALGQNRNFNGKVTRGSVLKGYTAVFRPTKKFTVKTKIKRSNDQVAEDIIAGRGGWGNNPVRATKLIAAGYNPGTIQTLINQKIAAKKKTSPRTITVQKGDGLSNIAKRAGYKDFGSASRWLAIAKLNGSSNWQTFNKNLKPGQKVKV